jgi:hypothetical protein
VDSHIRVLTGTIALKACAAAYWWCCRHNMLALFPHVKCLARSHMRHWSRFEILGDMRHSFQAHLPTLFAGGVTKVETGCRKCGLPGDPPGSSVLAEGDRRSRRPQRTVHPHPWTWPWQRDASGLSTVAPTGTPPCCACTKTGDFQGEPEVTKRYRNEAATSIHAFACAHARPSTRWRRGRRAAPGAAAGRPLSGLAGGGPGTSPDPACSWSLVISKREGIKCSPIFALQMQCFPCPIPL